jgi:hypothetical protein
MKLWKNNTANKSQNNPLISAHIAASLVFFGSIFDFATDDSGGITASSKRGGMLLLGELGVKQKTFSLFRTGRIIWQRLDYDEGLSPWVIVG